MKKLEKAHSKVVTKLSKPGWMIVTEMSPLQAELLHMAVGISGESGELLDAIKKYVIYQRPLDRKNILEELGDIEFFLCGVRNLLGISRDVTLKMNIKKLLVRYGTSYSNKAACERRDKKLKVSMHS